MNGLLLREKTIRMNIGKMFYTRDILIIFLRKLSFFHKKKFFALIFFTKKAWALSLPMLFYYLFCRSLNGLIGKFLIGGFRIQPFSLLPKGFQRVHSPGG